MPSRSTLRKWWTAGKFTHDVISDISHVFDTDLACIKTVDGEVAEEGKEADALTDLRGRVLSVGHKAQGGFLLLRRAIQEGLEIKITTI
jgi:hypothetical protein